MKILFAIQGTGNGHISRAREIIPHLKKYGDVDLLISGTEAEVSLDDEIKYKLNGLGFVFGQKGGVDFWETWKQFDTSSFINDIRKLPVNDYDLVINDFEPVTAWACKLKGKRSVAMSHQSAYLSPQTPQIKGFHWGKVIMNNYAPNTNHVAFHFEKYDDFVHTPVIRSGIRNMKTGNLGHYTVYLPAYSDEFIIEQISKFPDIQWQIFSKHSITHYQKENAEIFPVNNEQFNTSLSQCNGLLTGGGFEGPAEALFLGKKVLAVPMHHQYEQQCNALALERMGVPVIWHEREFPEKLRKWIFSDKIIEVNFPNETEEIVKKVIDKYG